MLAAALALLVVSETPDGGAAPSPREMAQLFFLAGDLRRAVDAGRRCIEVEGKKKCEGLYRALVEYQALVPRNDHLSHAEAKAYLEWDHEISPKAAGKLTAPVRQRYVTGPLEAAQRAFDQGDRDKAQVIVKAVLEVEPGNADAKKLLQSLGARP
jgi:hypothetical protein